MGLQLELISSTKQKSSMVATIQSCWQKLISQVFIAPSLYCTIPLIDKSAISGYVCEQFDFKQKAVTKSLMKFYNYITVNRPFNPFGWHRIGPWKRQLSEWRNQEPQTLWSFQLTRISWQWNWGPSGAETVPSFRNLFHFGVHSHFLYGHCCREHPLHWQRPFWSLYHGCSHS